MPVSETTLESFLDNDITILDELIGTEASELSSLLSQGAISGMEQSEILNTITAASSSSAQRALINTRLNTYSRVATNTMMKDAPQETKYVYIGPVDGRTRAVCLEMVSAGRITQSSIIRNFGASVLVDGGGYNCRHKWEIASEEGSRFHDPKGATQALAEKKDKLTKVVSSFSNVKDATKYIDDVSLETLTKSENDIIQEYTGARHDRLNNELRTHNNLMLEQQKFPNMVVDDLSLDVLKDTNNLNQALTKLPSYDGTVFRGVSFDNTADYTDFINSLQKGQTISRPTFTSTSLSQELAESFAIADDYGALVKIESKSGKWLNGLSTIEEEMEVLFQTDTVFEITNIKTISVYDINEAMYRDMVQITMKEI